MKLKIFISVVAIASITSTSLIATIASSQQSPTNKLGFGFHSGLVAGKDFVPGQLIIGIKPGVRTQSLTQLVSMLGGQVRGTITGTAFLIQFKDEKSVNAAVNSLVGRGDVVFVERNGIVSIPPKPRLNITKPGLIRSNQITPQVVSNDPATGFQWQHPVIRKTANLGVLSLTPPTIAVIDTGVDYTHPDLSAKVIKGLNAVANNFDPFDDNGHGTHVAGIAAASAANNLYGEGVSPNSKILAVKVLGADGSGTNFDVARGMAYARTVVTTPPTRIINMSLGGSSSSLIATEVLNIKNAGKVLVAAAGNDNTTSTTDAFPGADPNTALRVMATEQHDCRAYFSNFSPAAAVGQYNIAAPGWNIPSTLPNYGYGELSGTSMSSPVVAGAAALVWGQFPTLTRDQLVARLVSNGKLTSCGFAVATRRLDVRKALFPAVAETALVGRILDPFTAKAPSVNTNPVNARLFFSVTQLSVDGTNQGGFYEMIGLSAGTGRVLRGDRVGLPNAALRTGLNITTGLVNGLYTDALPQARPIGNATITLDWKALQPIFDTPGCVDSCNGHEFDLLVKTPSGEYIDPFSNQGSLVATPFVKNPRDSFNDNENLETSVIGSSAVNGPYKVVVDKYPSIAGSEWNPSWAGSLASVQFYNGATALGGLLAPPASCATSEYWYVGNLNKSGTAYSFTPVNTCSNTKP